MNGIAQLVVAAAQRYGVAPALALAVAQQESGLDPNAVSPTSSAKGVMQLLDATARDLGVTNPFDPAQNTDAGVRYLAQLLAKYGDVAEAVAAYRWGQGNVDRAIARWGTGFWAIVPDSVLGYVTAIIGSPPAGAPRMTIDAATGEPVAEAAGFVPAGLPEGPLTAGKILLLTAAAFGVYLLSDLLED